MILENTEEHFRCFGGKKGLDIFSIQHLCLRFSPICSLIKNKFLMLLFSLQFDTKCNDVKDIEIKVFHPLGFLIPETQRVHKMYNYSAKTKLPCLFEC